MAALLYFCFIILRQIGLRRSLVVWYGIIGLSVNKLTADVKYSPDNRRISRDQFKRNYLRNKYFLWIFHCINEIDIFEYFEKKRWASPLKYLRNYWLQNMWLLKYQKGPVSEHTSAVNVSAEIWTTALLSYF